MLTEAQRTKLRTAGYSDAKIKAYEVKKFGAPQREGGIGAFVKDAANDINQGFIGAGDAIAGGLNDAVGAYKQSQTGERNPIKAGFDIAGNVVRGVSEGTGELLMGGAKAAVTDDFEQKTGDFVQEKATQVMETPVAQQIKAKYDTLTPDQKQDAATVTNLVMGVLDAVGFKAGSVATRAAREGIETGIDATGTAVRNTADSVGNVVDKLPSPSLISEPIQRVGDRVKRAIDRGGEAVSDIRQQRELIQEIRDMVKEKPLVGANGQTIDSPNNSPTYNFYSQIESPDLKKKVADTEVNAIRIGIPENIRNDVKLYDAPTLKLANDMIGASEAKGKTLRFTDTPRDIAGKNFVNTFTEYIEKPRRAIGDKINTKVQKLSTNRTEDISDALEAVEDSLFDNGVAVIRGADGNPKLTLTGESSLTDKQFTVIKGLYEAATRGGNNLSPKAIRAKDELFSKIKREALSDDVSDLVYTKADGSRGNIYDDFRTIFNERLGQIDPELQALLREYAPYAQYRDLVEGQILGIKPSKQVKGQKYTDFYKNAGLSLRKMTTNYASSNDIAQLVKAVEELAKKNGYKGASNLDANLFARELENYFDISPSGSLRGIMDDTADRILDTKLPTDKEGIVQKVLEIGKVNREDQAKAIKDYIQAIIEAK